MKSDLSQREIAIEEKNKEILRLKIQVEELARLSMQRSQPVSPMHSQAVFGQLDSTQRRQLVIDLAYLSDTLRGEILRIKQHILSSQGSQLQLPQPTNMVNTLRNKQILSENDL